MRGSVTAMPLIDSSRLWQRLMAMAEIGRRGETGVDRPAFSLEDRAARRLLCSWGREHGLEVTQDPIGNLFLRYSAGQTELAPVLTGSHLDSQPTGGRFDGVFGVLAALEAVAALAHAGVRLARPIEVVAWSNEEGSRFAPGSMGSQVFAGVRSLEEVLQVQDSHGVRLGAALADTLAALPEAPLRGFGPAPSAYLEAHIEQGPRLERERVPLGVVTGIQGCLWLECELRGVAAHAGTTPQEYRRDAFEGAVRLIESLRARCLTRAPECRFTVGRVEVEPNTPNTIPGRVTFTIDFRHSDPWVFGELARELLTTRAPAPFELDVRELFCAAPKMFPPDMTLVVAEAVRSLGYPAFEIVSGAFHDSLFVAAICPTAMIFVRCRGGVSHNPLEYAEPADLAIGAQALLQALMRLAAK